MSTFLLLTGRFFQLVTIGQGTVACLLCKIHCYERRWLFKGRRLLLYSGSCIYLLAVCNLYLIRCDTCCMFGKNDRMLPVNRTIWPRGLQCVFCS